MRRAPLLAVLAAAFASGTALADRPLVLSGGTVVDGYGGPPLRDGVVVIEGERITAVGTLDSVTLPADARRRLRDRLFLQLDEPSGSFTLNAVARSAHGRVPG